MKAASVQDYRRLAKKRVPHFLFEYLDGGSYAEVTKERNRADLESLAETACTARRIPYRHQRGVVWPQLCNAGRAGACRACGDVRTARRVAGRPGGRSSRGALRIVNGWSVPDR